MEKLLVIGASNYVAQGVIKKLKSIKKIVGVSIAENTDRHNDYLKLKQSNLTKIIHDIRDDFPNWLDEILNQFKEFDSFIYFPCQNSQKPFLDISKADFDYSVDINGYLPFAITQKLIPGMIKINSGRIIYISTIWSVIGAKGKNNFDYAITKPMLNQLAKQVTANYMDKNITATSLFFGASEIHKTMRKEKFPILSGKRIISFEETEDIIIRLLNKNNNSFAGTSLLLDGGDFHINGM